MEIMIADILKGELEEETETAKLPRGSRCTETPNSTSQKWKMDASSFLVSQICARCLSPILGPRRKLKICELCTAKMTYVSLLKLNTLA